MTPLNMKKCTKCGVLKNSNEFYHQNDRESKTSMCKKCFNKYCSERWINKKIEAIIYKGSECQDCKLKYPNEPYVIFEFHHLNPKNKEFDWTQLKTRSKDIIKKELDKCMLLCSNCHRKRHHS